MVFPGKIRREAWTEQRYGTVLESLMHQHLKVSGTTNKYAKA